MLNPENSSGRNSARPLHHVEGGADLQHAVIELRVIHQCKDYLCLVTRCNWSGTLNDANAKPLAMTGNNKVRTVSLGEWSVSPA